MNAPVRSCAAVGPMACAAAPTQRTDLCAQSGPCVLLRAADPTFLEDLTIECGDPPFSEPAQPPAAPAGHARVPGVALANLVGVTGMMVRAAASYLVVELAEGACLVDVVHAWDMSPSAFETTLETRWEHAATGLRLHVQSQQTLHEPLDDGEFAEGVSDIRSERCERIVYDVAGNTFTPSSRTSTERPCEAAQAP